MSMPESDSPQPEPSQPPQPLWHRHPALVGAVIGALLGLFNADTRRRLPGEDLHFGYSPWHSILLYTWGGFILGLIKASFDGLPVGLLWAVVAVVYVTVALATLSILLLIR